MSKVSWRNSEFSVMFIPCGIFLWLQKHFEERVGFVLAPFYRKPGQAMVPEHPSPAGWEQGPCPELSLLSAWSLVGHEGGEGEAVNLIKGSRRARSCSRLDVKEIGLSHVRPLFVQN